MNREPEVDRPSLTEIVREAINQNAEYKESVHASCIPKNINLPDFPKALHQDVYMVDLADELCAKSKFGDNLEHAWIYEVRTKKFEEFTYSGFGVAGDGNNDRWDARFQALDGYLMSLLLEQKKSKWKEKEKMRHDNYRFTPGNGPMRGRQIIRWILDGLNTNYHQ